MENLAQADTSNTVPTVKEEICGTVSSSPLASALYVHFRKYRPELLERMEDDGDKISKAIG